uniref:hypothetical protein n=1 Tax=Roseivirga sp. TaxID=1964215 RepID=UPI0040483880
MEFGRGDLSFLSHELFHAYEFETGEISLPLHLRLNVISPLKWLAYDLEDEKAGDDRADFFGFRTKSSASYANLDRTLDGQRFRSRTYQVTVNNLIYSSHASRQFVATDTKQAFRVGGKTYRPEN